MVRETAQNRIQNTALRAAHWRSKRRLTLALLAIWLLSGFCTVFFARQLSSFTLFGWPLSFYMAAQGAALIYLALIGFYAWRMRRLDRAFAGAIAGKIASTISATVTTEHDAEGSKR